MLKKKKIFILIMFLFLLPTSYVYAEKGSLQADNITYNINSKKAYANGNVIVKRENATIWGDVAEGNTETLEFKIKGNVMGDFPEDNSKLKADSVTWKKETKALKDDTNVIEAFGKVFLTREPKDYLRADYVRWETETTNYSARGKVDGYFENKIIKAHEIGRTEKGFWGNKVERYEDTKQKIGIAAETIVGTLKNDEIQTAVAKSHVVIDYIDGDGTKSIVTGNMAEYSKEHATITVSGNARLTRSDGKTATADKFILHEDTRNIEAIGNTKMTFDIPEENNKSENDKKMSDK